MVTPVIVTVPSALAVASTFATAASFTYAYPSDTGVSQKEFGAAPALIISSETSQGVLSTVPPTPTLSWQPSVMPFKTSDCTFAADPSSASAPAATRSRASCQTQYAAQSAPAVFMCVLSTFAPFALR